MKKKKKSVDPHISQGSSHIVFYQCVQVLIRVTFDICSLVDTRPTYSVVHVESRVVIHNVLGSFKLVTFELYYESRRMFHVCAVASVTTGMMNHSCLYLPEVKSTFSDFSHIQLIFKSMIQVAPMP